MKPTPVLDAIEAAARERETPDSTCTLDARAFWQLAKELGAPHHKSELLVSFEGEPTRRVLVTKARVSGQLTGDEHG